MESERPVVISTRVAPAERGRIQAVAIARGISVCELLHQIIVPAVDDHLRRDLATAGVSNKQRGS